MKVNFDKEMLVKHKFWIMLMIAVPMILASQIVLAVYVAGDIEKQRKKVEGEVKSAKGYVPQAYNNDNLEAKEKEVEESSPARTHSARNTELSTSRPAGGRPNETFEMPRIVLHSGKRVLIARIPSMVSTAEPT